MARFFYNSAVRPRDIDNLLAKKSKNIFENSEILVKTRIFQRASSPSVKVTNKIPTGQHKLHYHPVVHPRLRSDSLELDNAKSTHIESTIEPGKCIGRGLNVNDVKNTQQLTNMALGLNPHQDCQVNTESNEVQNVSNNNHTNLASNGDIGCKGSENSQKHENPCKTVIARSMGLCPVTHSNNMVSGSNLKNQSRVNSTINEKVGLDGPVPLYDVNSIGVEEKFANSIMHFQQFNKSQVPIGANSQIFKEWSEQSDFQFGFIPLGEQVMPGDLTCNTSKKSLLEIHDTVRQSGKPNFLGARIPVVSQLNVEAWEKHLKGYWDQQLLQLLKFGFPLDFNRDCPLQSEKGNHSSATQFPKDVDAYIEEESRYGAILGPFKENPIQNCHTSPFMTRNKPNSDRRRVIIDLSWPIGASVNAGIDKDTYLNSPFALTFPTIDDITSQLKRLGRGALLYKIDVSRAFRHVRVDPGDFDLLGLQWRHAYVDTCLPFGTRHGSQIFQSLSDAVRHVMRQKGFCVIDYIDDYVGMGVTDVAHASFNALFQLMGDLGLTISESKLVPPSTQVVCLGILINTENGTVSIPPEKLRQISDTVRQWLGKTSCTKRQLQSILGMLLYVHKCVKPARAFLNRMLALLRSGHAAQKITLTPEFKRDLRWFDKFLPLYNGVSLYDHRPIDHTLELDACLKGLGGRWCRYVYHLPIPEGHMNWSIVHLEMINILLSIRLFQAQWAGRKVLIKCDNEAVVTVLRSGRARDPFLGACARNIWYAGSLADMDIQYVHIRGLDNRVADLLSRWTGCYKDVIELQSHVQDPIWVPVSMEFLEIDPEL